LVNSILKGLTTDQAYKKSQQAMIKNFRYMISSNAKSVEKEVASFLWLNIKNQVILGNKDSLF
jgi:isopentenyldiphosphate isomerase